MYIEERGWVKGNNLQLYKDSILVITATLFFFHCYSCIVILLELLSTKSSHILHSYHWVYPTGNTKILKQQNKGISTPRGLSQERMQLFWFSRIQCLHLMYSEGTSIFGNSSSVANNIQSRLPSRLSFRFL